MSNGTLGLSIGRSALMAQQRALEVVSQNLANANTEGYARKTVGMVSNASINLPDYQGPVYFSQIGTGVSTGRIESVRDLVLNERIRNLKSQAEESREEQAILDQLEALFTGELDLQQSIDDFFSALHDLSGAPDSLTVRSVVRARGEELTERVREAAASIEEIRANVSAAITSKAAVINGYAQELAALNERVAAMSAAGLAPNDFEDKRQLVLEKLSLLGDVQTVSGPSDTLMVLLGGQVIVQGTQSYAVEVRNGESPEALPVLAVGPGTSREISARSGVLAALSAIQAGPLTTLRNDLNELAVSLTTSFNAVHATGFGLDGSTGTNFFTIGTPPSTETRVYSILGTGYVPSTSTPLDGDATTQQPENFEQNPVGQGRFVLNGISIEYDGSVDSLEDIVARINASNANVTATITPQNRLMLTGTRQGDYTIATMADSGGNLLARLGILNANQAYPAGLAPRTSAIAGTITMRPADDAARRFGLTSAIAADLNRIAAAQGEDLSDPPDGIGDRSRGPGDGANALTLAQLRETRVMARGTGTFTDFVTGFLGELGVQAGTARRTSDGLDAQIAQLEARRDEIQGVSIDEELINMIKYQRGFEAAARIVSVMDQVLQTLLALGR